MEYECLVCIYEHALLGLIVTHFNSVTAITPFVCPVLSTRSPMTRDVLCLYVCNGVRLLQNRVVVGTDKPRRFVVT